MIIHKAAGVIIKDRKLLVTRSKQKLVFMSPGGKIEPGESPIQALIRELNEELQIKVEEKDLSPLKTFTAPASGNEQDQLIMDVFMINHFEGNPTPDNEIEEVAWISTSFPKQMKIGSIFEHEVIPLLKSMDLID
jgi:8-oxo-dGTP diphosphatase